MRFGYTIMYVPDVEATVAFYERAFGLARRFVHESGTYAELDTGATALAFAADALGAANLPQGYRPNTLDGPPAGIEIALVSDDVEDAFHTAVAAGAIPLVAPKTKPWGQVVGYVRDLNGVLIELCSPMD
jgi:lactoylglutathione lyase